MTQLLDVEGLAPFGAKVRGIDIDAFEADPDAGRQILDLLERHSVLIFPEFGTDDVKQIRFSRCLGEIITASGAGSGSGRFGDYPEIYHVGFGDQLSNRLYVKGAFAWHLDGAMDPIPTKASLLNAHAIADKGGDTQFLNTYVAYDRLTADEQREFADLRVRHSAESAYRKIDPNPTDDIIAALQRVPVRTHPLIWTHRSGRKSLVLGATALDIEGMSHDESRAFIDALLDRMASPDNVLQHHWTVGDLVMWDNRGTLHRAMHYEEDSGRMMHRVTLVGDEPIE